MGKCVMRIIVNEERKKNEATYEDIIHYLWQNGVPGATAFRSTASIDDKKQLHYQLLENVYFNDLAIIIESPELQKAFTHIFEKRKRLV